MGDVLLEARDLERRYPGRGLSGRGTVVAVDRVSFALQRGEALGLVGESGSGKSTLARLLLALERPDRGTVSFAGVPISHLRPAAVRPLRRRFQAVFQDPVSSLNPRLSVATIVEEALVAHRLGDRAARRLRVAEVLGLVGLPADASARFPAAFSGGERQRVALARALAPEPELLVLDAPVSSLDVLVQAQILALLADLRRRLGLSLVLISHELEVVREVCDRVAVMVAGRIVEIGPTEAVLDRPVHPSTRALRAAAPVLPELGD
jgi:ABC-type glutathione transport system ATPase component